MSQTPEISEQFFAAGQLIRTVHEGDLVPVYQQLDLNGMPAAVTGEAICNFSQCRPIFNRATTMIDHVFDLHDSFEAQLMKRIDQMAVMRLMALYVTMEQLNAQEHMTPEERDVAHFELYAHEGSVSLADAALQGLLHGPEQVALGKHWMEQFGYKTGILNHVLRHQGEKGDATLNTMLVIEQADHVLLCDPFRHTVLKDSFVPDAPQGVVFPVPTMYRLPKAQWDQFLALGREKRPVWTSAHNDSVWRHATAPQQAWFGFDAIDGHPGHAAIAAKGTDFRGPWPG